jgi:hypothetical protein
MSMGSFTKLGDGACQEVWQRDQAPIGNACECDSGVEPVFDVGEKGRKADKTDRQRGVQ